MTPRYTTGRHARNRPCGPPKPRAAWSVSQTDTSSTPSVHVPAESAAGPVDEARATSTIPDAAIVIGIGGDASPPPERQRRASHAPNPSASNAANVNTPTEVCETPDIVAEIRQSGPSTMVARTT